jgi:hypothetical protein
MNHPYYDYEASSDAFTFQFFSQGKITVLMQVAYTETPSGRLPQYDPIYNLALLAFDTSLARFSDKLEVNNGDMPLIFATVTQTLRYFSFYYPSASIIFTGSNQQRTRVYDLLVKRYREELSTYYNVLGFREGSWEKIDSHYKYEGFLLLPKK